MATKSVQEKYQKLTQREHVYRLPDTYVGSCEPSQEIRWVLDAAKEKMEQTELTFVPGLFKIFDEVLVNSRDHRVRDPTVKNIKVIINQDSGEISIENSGSGIEIEVHPEHNVYVPELIFGHLLTSSNYDPEEKRTTGGKNGMGVKLAAIFSKMFRIETIDADRKKKYVQEFTDNLETINPPKITASSSKPFTRITFLPDYERFGVAGMTDDIYAVLEARVYDMAACTPADLAVSLNNTTLKIKTFEKYMDLYLGSKDECPRVFEKVNERWEVGVGLTDGHFQQISFVNGVNTYKGTIFIFIICFLWAQIAFLKECFIIISMSIGLG